MSDMFGLLRPINLSVPNGDDNNIDAGGDVDISAPNGFAGI